MNIFVTGGSGGIGAAIVRTLVNDGHSVAFTYHQNQVAADQLLAELSHLPVMIRAYPLEVQKSAAVNDLADTVLDTFDSIQVVVNNAGIIRSNLAVMMTDDEWEAVLQTNLSGAFYVCRSFLPDMIAGGFGRIINISSSVAHGATGMVNYAAAKAGLMGLTQTLAKEYGKKGITTNCLLVGDIQSTLSEQHTSPQVEAFRKQFIPQPSGRSGTPQEVADLVRFLAAEAAGYINGACIPLTGGLDWIP